VEGNCSNAKETVVSINPIGGEKQTTKRDKHKKTHNNKKKIIKKNGAQARPWAPL
jgi:hypothetical protein